MARGITETDVWSACDALLLAGDRPTIERVRQQLGRGSPNTVSPMLDAWFKGLGARISDPGAFAAPPDIPDTVGQAAKHFWEVALAETRRDFDERLREGMAAAIANVEAEKERAAMADAAAYTASAKLTRATAEATELRALLDQERTLRATDLARLDEAKRQIDRLVHEAQATAAAAAEERAQAQRHVETAQARFEAAERRAALESDSERSARAKADKR
ncbi:MAG: DNA-binding protein, partial [Hyphomicrobiales bacterium]|nr:DNA-binding protein [Hyphomicrobiales bacterium]